MIIKLSRNKTTIVDECDWPLIKDYTWYCTAAGYVASRSKGIHVYLHRLIMKPEVNEVIDHINHNTLDNRRINLRVVMRGANNQNRKGSNKNSKSGIRGVYWEKDYKHWGVKRMINYKHYLIGYFPTLRLAKKALSKFNSEVMNENK